ncbi:MAG: YhfC family intramembrane metalloprotease [Oscillospiraceae bacterium]|nr:YhfC family intramembrane metalloprotease [Oscillospiraceae bacterium]
MTQHVPALSIGCMAAAGLVAFAIPIGLLIYYRTKKKADDPPFVAGLVVFLLFALVLERIAHSLVLGSAAGETIRGNLWLYALYGGAMAGIFEETGRYLAFRIPLRCYREKDVNALMYGAGHGGIEAAVMLGLTSVSNIAFSVMLNTGRAEELTAQLSGDTLAQVQEAMGTLSTTPSWLFLLGAAERIAAVAMHLSFSVLVWFAVKKKKRLLFPLAILLHLLADAVTVLASGSGVPTPAIEGILAVIAAGIAVIAYRVWKAEHEEAPPPSDGEPQLLRAE